jgi:hypothetical protein
VHAFGPLRNRFAVVARAAELPRDPGGLGQPSRLPRLSLALVADPATPPAAKVVPARVQVCDSAGAAEGSRTASSAPRSLEGSGPAQ